MQSGSRHRISGILHKLTPTTNGLFSVDTWFESVQTHRWAQSLTEELGAEGKDQHGIVFGTEEKDQDSKETVRDWDLDNKWYTGRMLYTRSLQPNDVDVEDQCQVGGCKTSLWQRPEGHHVWLDLQVYVYTLILWGHLLIALSQHPD